MSPSNEGKCAGCGAISILEPITRLCGQCSEKLKAKSYQSADTVQLTTFKKQIRQAIADYMASEGCACCRRVGHEDHAAVIAKLLDVPPHSDGSGFEFYKFRSPE